MVKVLRCRKVGMDCDFEARADTKDDSWQRAAAHEQTAHAMQELTPEPVTAVHAAMREA